MVSVRKETLYTLLLYALLVLVSGMMRLHLIISVLQEGNKFALSFVSFFSVLISIGFILFIIVCTAVCTYIYVYVTKTELKIDDLLLGWRNLLIIDFISELVKFILLWIIFLPELKSLTIVNASSVSDLIKPLLYNKIVYNIDQFTIYISIIAFMLTIHNRFKEDNTAIFGLGLVVLMVNILFFYKVI